MKKAKIVIRKFLAKPSNDYILLGLMVGLVTVINLVWIFAETRPPHWDMGRHLWTSLNYLDIFKNGKPYDLLASYFYYPPALYLVAIPFYLVFGVSVPTAVFSNVIFIAIGVFSMYGIGKQLWNRRTGLLASLFLLCSPMMITQFKEFQIDAPLTAMVSLSVYLLIRCQEFLSTKLSILLGITLGLGLLTKWTYGFIIAAPIGLAILISLIRTYQEKNWRRLVNILACFSATYIVTSIWYITNKHQIMIDLTQNGVGAGAREGDPIVGTFASNIWYGWNLISNQLYILPFIFLAIGIVFLFIKREYSWKNRYPIAVTAGTLLLFTMLRNKDARYTLPALVGIGTLATYWIAEIKHYRLKNVVSLGLTAYLIGTFYLVSFGCRYLPAQVVIAKGTYPIIGYAQKGYLIGKPSGEDWHIDKLFKELGDMPLEKRKLYYFGPDSIWFNNWDLTYYAKRYNVQLVSSPDAATIVIIRTAPQEKSQANKSDRVLSLPDGGTLVVKENY